MIIILFGSKKLKLTQETYKSRLALNRSRLWTCMLNMVIFFILFLHKVNRLYIIYIELAFRDYFFIMRQKKIFKKNPDLWYRLCLSYPFYALQLISKKVQPNIRWILCASSHVGCFERSTKYELIIDLLQHHNHVIFKIKPQNSNFLKR